MIHAGLDHLLSADWRALGAAIQAQALRDLGTAQSKLTVARSEALGAFDSSGGYTSDGHGSARTWLKNETSLSGKDARDLGLWERRLTAHPVLRDAIAAGELSQSWAQQLALWNDRLPDAEIARADQVLLDAARAGLPLTPDIARLAQAIHETIRGQSPDTDPDDDGHRDRSLRLATTLGGAGRVHGDLTPGCAALLEKVLDAFGRPLDGDDFRTQAQRSHDALETALGLSLAAPDLPQAGGMKTHAHVTISLADLMAMDGGSVLAQRWLAAQDARLRAATATRPTGTTAPNGTGLDGASPNGFDLDGASMDDSGLSAAGANGTDLNGAGVTAAGLNGTALNGAALHGRAGEPGHLTGAEAAATACAAHITPVVTGTPDWDVLSAMADVFLHAHGLLDAHEPGQSGTSARGTLTPDARLALERTLLAMAIQALSGPGGLAGFLRANLLGRPYSGAPIPLDIGDTDHIPGHLRRAVIMRDRTCQWPGGCNRPASHCEPHHLRPRHDGGETSLANLLLLCRTHHHHFVHRLGWTIMVHPDGTRTATSPTGKTLRSHGPRLDRQSRTRTPDGHGPPAAATAPDAGPPDITGPPDGPGSSDVTGRPDGPGSPGATGLAGSTP